MSDQYPDGHLTDGWEPDAPVEDTTTTSRLPTVGVFSDLSRASAEAFGFLPLTHFTLWHRAR